MMPRRPLRSVWLGNPRYLSVYGLGVAQAMGIMGHWHRSVSIFDDLDTIKRQIEEMSPDVIWTHMILWPPKGARKPSQTLSILSDWKRRGTAVYLHDGDPRERDITDVNWAFSVALVNRSVEVGSHFNIPSIRWPYAAMVQKEIGPPRDEWACDLLFAGHMRDDSLYRERTTLVNALQQRLGQHMRVVSPGAGAINNRLLVADVAPSVGAILGFARPEVPGWIDTRVFQYGGSGGILIHDDAGEFLEPDVHYLKFDRKNAVESIVLAVEQAKSNGQIRHQAFTHIQANHTWIQRVDAALKAFYGNN